MKVKVVLELDQLSVKLNKTLYDSHLRFLDEMSPHDHDDSNKLSPYVFLYIQVNLWQTHFPTGLVKF